MIKLEEYNPCLDRIKYLQALLAECVGNKKQIKIKYDKKAFITNIPKSDLKNISFLTDYDYFFNNRNLLVIRAKDIFFSESIEQCPEAEFQSINNIYLESILKRMYSQIEFGFFTEDFAVPEFIKICDKIFKSIYTRSQAVKIKNIKSSLEIYNKLQKSQYVNRKIIYGIIYAVYDYSNQMTLQN